ncbi:MAG: hypothetical protein ACOZHQ_00075 [Thermodesulfobacteriota bacterium]
MRLRDLLLVIATFGGMGIGVLIPETAGQFKSATPYLLMALMFLSFLRLDLAALLKPQPGAWLEVALWSGLKLLALPLAMWAIFRWLWPDWALAALALSAVSAGVTSPFFASLLGADMPRVIITVVVTSLVLPISLPALIRLLTGASTEVPFLPMFWLLAMMIFAPAALMGLARRWTPGLVGFLGRVGYPASLALMFIISVIVFAPFGQHFRDDPARFLVAVAVSFALWAFYVLSALLLGRALPGRLTPLTGMVAMVYVNNVLGVVFAARFLDFNSVLLCGCYLFPIYLALLPLRWLRDRLPWVAGRA